MKVSLNWIKEYVALPSNFDISKLAYDLTMSTVEVEEVKILSKKFENIVVGSIEEVKAHPNADKLRICKTRIENGEIKDIVCGGNNLKVGMKVAVACPGAMVRWHGTGDLVEIKKVKLRGVESYGMICAASEIGLADLFPSEEGSIIDLSRFDADNGTNIAKALGLDDVILEIDNKSLTNRPDLWGHYGIAREISALYDLPLKKFVPFEYPKTSNLKINLKDTEHCLRYIGVKIEDVLVKPSNFEIQSRLWSVGIRPINAIVDITNYVMLATGQPLHAFDADNIKGDITVRFAKSSDKMTLLDGKELSLSTEDLVIADEEGPIALAGVMGGKKDSVLPKTNKVILEIANFEPSRIRRTALKYETRTESATRYEKGIDPERCDQALSLAMQMFADIFKDMSVAQFGDNYPKHFLRKEVDVSLDWLERCLGERIAKSDIINKLSRLGFEVEFNQNIMHVIVPTWRSTGDISIPNDIMEEIARMYGLENFDPTPITISFSEAINQPAIDIDRKIREYLAFRCGMNEIFTYPWINNKYIDALSLNRDEMLSLSAPISSEEHYLRSSLLPNLCKSVAENLRNFNEFSIFESAQVYFNKDFESIYDSRELLPLQRRNIAGAYVGNTENVNSLFRRVKGIVESMPRYVHIEPFTMKKIEKPVWADNVVWLNIIQENKKVGNLALLSKKASLACGIKNSAALIFEIDMDLLIPCPSRTNKFMHISEYPVAEYDLSLLFDLSVKWQEIFDVVKDIKADNLIQDILFIDEYRGSQVPDGKKSVTFRLKIGSFEKTLTSSEIEGVAAEVIKRLKKDLGAEIRV